MIPEIEKWLFTATCGLAQQEIKRIQADVKEHFADACLVYQEKGLTSAEAEARALADLGKASAANKKYRNVYFTHLDNERIRMLLGRSWWSYLFAVVLPMIFLMIVFEPPTTKVVAWYEWLVGVVWILAFWLLCIFEPKVKTWIFQASPSFGLLGAQLFHVSLGFFLAHFILVDGKPAFAWLWLLVMGLWLGAQLPLTIKSIRRLRA